MNTIEIQAYSFSELSESVQEKLINENLDFIYSILNSDFSERAKQYLSDQGLDDVDVNYSLSNCQGDGVAFYGTVDASKIAHMLEPKDAKVLSKIKDNVTINIYRSNTRYDHYNTMRVYVELDGYHDRDYTHINKVLERVEQNILQHIQDYSKELERIGYEDYFDNAFDMAKQDLEAQEYLYSKCGEIIGGND